MTKQNTPVLFSSPFLFFVCFSHLGLVASETRNGQLLSGWLVKGGLSQRSSQPGPGVLLVAALRLGRAQHGPHRRVDLVRELAGEVAQAPSELAVEPGLGPAPIDGEDGGVRAGPELGPAHAARVVVAREVLRGKPEVSVVEGLRHARAQGEVERERERERMDGGERGWEEEML